MPRTRRLTNPSLDALTPRELEVLEVMVTGARDQDIAQELGITVATVKVHLHNVYTKLDVSNRVEATRHYLDPGRPRKRR
jgi:LuxR family maltose regulon positive regulatory protein